MHISEALVEFAYSKDHTPESRRWYRYRLTAFTTWLAEQGITDIAAITPGHVRRYLDYRRTATSRTGKCLDSHTLHGHMRAVRCFLKWAVSDDLLDARTANKVPMPRKAVKVLPVLDNRQIERMFSVCETHRDRALLAVLLDTGVRASELCGLTMDSVYFDPDDPYIIVTGKGRKSREVGLSKRSRQLLHRYMTRERRAASDVSAVFVGRTGRQLRPEGLDRRLYKLRDQAGLQGVRVGAHTWRHTMAFNFIAAGGDIFRLSRLLGHSSVAVTQGYLSAFNSREARKGSSVLDSMGVGR